MRNLKKLDLRARVCVTDFRRLEMLDILTSVLEY